MLVRSTALGLVMVNRAVEKTLVSSAGQAYLQVQTKKPVVELVQTKTERVFNTLEDV